MKIFVLSDMPINSGFGRISGEIFLRLAQRGHEIHAASVLWDGVMPIWYTASLPLATTPRDPLTVPMLRQSVRAASPSRKPQVYGQWIGMFPAPVVASVTPTLRSWVTIT